MSESMETTAARMKKIYKQYKNIQAPAVAIGIFDGVHLGHQKILKKLVREAEKEKTKSLVITFYPHPREILKHSPKVPLLTSLEHRLRLIKELGVDSSVVVKFKKSLSRIKADDFIEKVLVKKLNMKTLVVGKDFKFGHNKKGDFSLLKKMSGRYGFKLFGIDPVKIKGSYVSSTRIREVIEKGGLKHASVLLGRPVVILGTVVKGRRIGRALGFPTANINPHHEAIPPSGVYVVDVKLNGKVFKGVLNIGTRPTFGENREPVIELHILNFRKNIYGKDAEIIFKKKIRKEKKFKTVNDLKEQIKKDILSIGHLPNM
jgi:riboflavin kinase / FMN adenylyltransferase